MRIACWILKTTNTHSEYVIIIAFPLQQLLRERTSILCYRSIAYLFLVVFNRDNSFYVQEYVHAPTNRTDISNLKITFCVWKKMRRL